MSTPSAGEAAGEAAGGAAVRRLPHQPQYAAESASWRELIGMFTKLGLVAFGGPVAHIAMMDREVVERRHWVDRQHFLDLMAATNLLPGPNSTQMTMHVGYVQKGDRGVLAAGAAFILPAMLVTLTLSWAWVRWRELPLVDAAFAGIQPVVLAIIVMAIVSLAPKAADDLRTRLILVAAVTASLLGVDELLVIAAGALLGWLTYRSWRRFGDGLQGLRHAMPPSAGAGALLLTLLAPWTLAAARAPAADPERVWQLWWWFLRFGVTLFGSGYLLVAYLQSSLVDRLGLLTTSQLLEAIVIGEMTPGPLFTVSTAIGYLLAGGVGAVVATVAIFLPSFPLAMLLGRIMPRLSRSTVARQVLRGLGAAVVGVMLAVGLTIGQRVVTDVPSALIAVGALVVLRFTRLGPIALVPVGAMVGWLLSLGP
jgi:chromate transporter